MWEYYFNNINSNFIVTELDSYSNIKFDLTNEKSNDEIIDKLVKELMVKASRLHYEHEEYFILFTNGNKKVYVMYETHIPYLYNFYGKYRNKKVLKNSKVFYNFVDYYDKYYNDILKKEIYKLDESSNSLSEYCANNHEDWGTPFGDDYISGDNYEFLVRKVCKFVYKFCEENKEKVFRNLFSLELKYILNVVFRKLSKNNLIKIDKNENYKFYKKLI